MSDTPELDPDDAKRSNDFWFTCKFFSLRANGKQTVLSMLGAGALLIACVAVWLNTREHQALSREMQSLIYHIAVNTCVLSLDPAERKDWRASGRYCTGYLVIEGRK